MVPFVVMVVVLMVLVVGMVVVMVVMVMDHAVTLVDFLELVCNICRVDGLENFKPKVLDTVCAACTQQTEITPSVEL